MSRNIVIVLHLHSKIGDLLETQNRDLNKTYGG